MSWKDQINNICEIAKVLSSCNVAEIEFENGTFFEVYFAMTAQQRKTGLSCISEIDLTGMLFCYDEPTFIPFSMQNTLIPLDIAWYDEKGTLLQMGTYKPLTSEPICCPVPFSFVLETPIGKLPSGNMRLRKN